MMNQRSVIQQTVLGVSLWLLLGSMVPLTCAQEKKTLADYHKAIAINPNDDKAYFERGQIYLSRGLQALGPVTSRAKAIQDLDNAIRDYNKAIQLHPHSAVAFAARGFAYAAKGAGTPDLDLFPRAIADFNKAILLDPTLVAAYRGKAQACEYGSLVIPPVKLCDNKELLAAYRKSIELAPPQGV